MNSFNDWSYTLSGEPELLAGRSFTGHEWLPWFNLYNMIGRLGVYPAECNGSGNPAVGRFLSPDNYVQDPFSSQNYNRYSYVLNNPLKYTDYSGEIWKIFKPFVQGAEWLWHVGLLAIDPVKASEDFMDWVNKKLEPVSNAMVDIGVPPIGGGYNTVEGPFHYVGDYRYYHRLSRQLAKGDQKVHKKIDEVKKAYGGDIFYKEGSYSFSDFYLQYLPAEGKGIFGGWSSVRGNANVYRARDGIYYANVSAVGYTPSNSRGSVTFSGNIEVYSGGILVGNQTLTRLGGASIIYSGWQNVGQGTIALPSYGNDVYLRFNVGYNYSEGAGYVSSWSAQGHSNLYIPYFVIDAWTY